MRALLDVTSAAYYLHTTSEAIRDLVKQRRIPYVQRGTKIYFVVRDLDAWIHALTVVSVEEAILAHRRPAIFPDTQDSQNPLTPPTHITDGGEDTLRRGRLGPKILPSLQR
jgi:excisionase family DNA binding protein